MSIAPTMGWSRNGPGDWRLYDSTRYGGTVSAVRLTRRDGKFYVNVQVDSNRPYLDKDDLLLVGCRRLADAKKAAQFLYAMEKTDED